MKIFMGKMCYEGTLLSTEEKQKRTEVWKLKLLFQMGYEAPAFFGVVDNSGCSQGNG